MIAFSFSLLLEYRIDSGAAERLETKLTHRVLFTRCSGIFIRRSLMLTVVDQIAERITPRWELLMKSTISSRRGLAGIRSLMSFTALVTFRSLRYSRR